MKDIIIVDDGITNEELVKEIDAVPRNELFKFEPLCGEVKLDGQFTKRELLLFALWLERNEQSERK